MQLFFYFIFRARAEAEEARQKAKEDDDVGVCVCIFLCIIHNGALEVHVHLVNVLKLYCVISSGELPPSIEKIDDLKSTSKLEMTMSSFFLPIVVCHILFEELFSSRLY